MKIKDKLGIAKIEQFVDGTNIQEGRSFKYDGYLDHVSTYHTSPGDKEIRKYFYYTRLEILLRILYNQDKYDERSIKETTRTCLDLLRSNTSELPYIETSLGPIPQTTPSP